jgi:hypothetical protein
MAATAAQWQRLPDLSFSVRSSKVPRTYYARPPHRRVANRARAATERAAETNTAVLSRCNKSAHALAPESARACGALGKARGRRRIPRRDFLSNTAGGRRFNGAESRAESHVTA